MSEAIAPEVAARLDRSGALEASMRPKGAFVFGVVFVIAALVTAVAVFLTVGAPSSRGAPSHVVLIILSLNLFLILARAVVAALRVISLFAPSAPDAGVRLHRRFVITFSLSALAPAVIMAVL